MRYPYYLALLCSLFTSKLSAEILTHSNVAQKKISYLSHFKHLSGSVDIEDGVLWLHKNLRLQTNKAYIENVPNRGLKLVAHGNIIINYHKITLVCDYLEYYEDTDTCLLTNGRFAVFPWYIGGSMITMTPETLLIHKGYISTSEGPHKHVQLSGDCIEYTSDAVLSIGGTTFSICNVPLILLPKISIMPMEIPKPPINFRGGSGGFLGSYLGISYSPISKKQLNTTFFLDSFFKHGIGIGYNMRFIQKDHPENTFNIKSYYAHRLAIDMAEAKDRYRLHGDFAVAKTRTKLFGEYHLSDSWETIADIFPNNFSLKNTGPTNINFFWRDDSFRGLLSASVKVNSFQSINQQLPYLHIKQDPIKLSKSGIFLENTIEGGYLNYSFSKYIDVQDNHNHFASFKTAITSNMYRPFSLYVGILTPSISGTAIYYHQLPQEAHKHTQASLQAKLDYRFTSYKTYTYTKHIVEPFIKLSAITKPVIKNDEHFIFSTSDAFHSLCLLQTGFDMSFINHLVHYLPRISTSCCTTYIFNNQTTKEVFPKTALTLRLPTYKKATLTFDAEWIWKKACWDHFNVLWQWAVNDDLAFTCEFLHRSKYSFMKCDRNNYILDVSRSLPELLQSALSDRRNTILSKFFARPHPHWNAQLSLRYGWHRKHAPHYLEYQIILGTKIFEHWQLYSVYEKREADRRCFFYLKLDKPKSSKKTTY